MVSVITVSYLSSLVVANARINTGSPLEARQELSDDETKALGVIKDKNLGGQIIHRVYYGLIILER